MPESDDDLPPGWLRVADHKEEWERLRQEARQEARRIACRLVEHHGARRVWLIGSTAGVWTFHCYSDIDIIVEGMAEETFRQAYNELEGHPRFRIDLRERSMFSDEFWEKLIPQPVLLDEQPQGTDR